MNELERARCDIEDWDRRERVRLLAEHSAERARRWAALQEKCEAAGHSTTVYVPMLIGHALDCSVCRKTVERGGTTAAIADGGTS